MARPPPDDGRLWRRATRDVAPLRGRDRPHPARRSEPHPHPNPPPQTGEGGAGVRAGGSPAAPPPLDRFAGVDRATAERLKRGRYSVEATLDLHGLTQDEAHRALSRCITGWRAAGRRCVLVVTGHGRATGGVLKAAVPRWLAEPDLRRDVLAIAPARPPHGGAGALYVLLRRLPR